MRLKSKKSFRPSVEASEGRILATVGLATAAPGPAAVHAESVQQAQAWVEIVNRTDRNLEIELSANGGSKYYGYQLREHSEQFYHVNHADPTFLLKLGDGSTTALATGTSRSDAPAYSIRGSSSVTPGPALGGGGGGGGLATPLPYTANFTILNQTSNPSGPGGVAVPIYFSVDGGKTYPLSDTVPYTGGRVPRHESFRYGNLGILYKFTPSGAVQGTPLTTLGQYYLFSNGNFQPYLSPSS